MAANRHAAMYRGLEPEISTLNDTILILGKPASKIINSKFTICKYQFVEVAVRKRTGKVSAIIIYDPTFKDVNGFMLNDPYGKISRDLNVPGTGNTIHDKNKKILYIFNQDTNLEKIVYGDLSP